MNLRLCESLKMRKTNLSNFSWTNKHRETPVPTPLDSFTDTSLSLSAYVSSYSASKFIHEIRVSIKYVYGVKNLITI